MPDGLGGEGHLTEQSLFLPSDSLELSRWQSSDRISLFMYRYIFIYFYTIKIPPFFVVITGYKIYSESFAGQILFRATSKFPLINNYHYVYFII